MVDINNTDFKVNRFKLEKECENQSSLYCYYSDLYSQAQIEKDKKALELEQVKANIDLDIRRNPPSEFKKLTESMIISLI
jgi:hypothetical protein